jgi:hypothetical protein
MRFWREKKQELDRPLVRQGDFEIQYDEIKNNPQPSSLSISTVSWAVFGDDDDGREGARVCYLLQTLC